MRKFILIVVLPILFFGSALLFLNLKKDKPVQIWNPFSELIGIQKNANAPQKQTSRTRAYAPDFVDWEFNGTDWTALSTPPACPKSIIFGIPVDPDFVTAVLYPGQTRNNNYQPDGGFAFKKSVAAMYVKAPMAGYLVQASRYMQQGITRYQVTFINPCGIMYRFNNLLTLSPNLQKILSLLPEAKGSAVQTPVNPPVVVLGGDVIGNTTNATLDFGVYDLRRKNGVTKPNDKQYAPYGVCWLNLFTPQTAARLKSLPVYDKASGKTSDYCK